MRGFYSILTILFFSFSIHAEVVVVDDSSAEVVEDIEAFVYKCRSATGDNVLVDMTKNDSIVIGDNTFEYTNTWKTIEDILNYKAFNYGPKVNVLIEIPEWAGMDITIVRLMEFKRTGDDSYELKNFTMQMGPDEFEEPSASWPVSMAEFFKCTK